jgi:hypothetical protein
VANSVCSFGWWLAAVDVERKILVVDVLLLYYSWGNMGLACRVVSAIKSSRQSQTGGSSVSTTATIKAVAAIDLFFATD